MAGDDNNDSVAEERTNESEPTKERMRESDDDDKKERSIWGSSLARLPQGPRASALLVFSRLSAGCFGRSEKIKPVVRLAKRGERGVRILQESYYYREADYVVID